MNDRQLIRLPITLSHFKQNRYWGNESIQIIINGLKVYFFSMHYHTNEPVFTCLLGMNYPFCA